MSKRAKVEDTSNSIFLDKLEQTTNIADRKILSTFRQHSINTINGETLKRMDKFHNKSLWNSYNKFTCKRLLNFA